MLSPKAFKVLSSESRIKILELLYIQPLSVEEIGEMIGLKPITVRHHINALGENGFIKSIETRSGRVGRPRIRYKISQDLVPVYYPSRLHLPLLQDMVEEMMNLLGEEETKTFLRKVGREMALKDLKNLVSNNGVDKWTPKAFRDVYVEGFLAGRGDIPEIVHEDGRRIVFRVNNCLYHELASKRPHLFCGGLEEGYYAELSRGMGGNVKFRTRFLEAGNEYCEIEIYW